jgi:hypothetical protein
MVVYVFVRYSFDLENRDNKIFVTWYFLGTRETMIFAADWIPFYLLELNDKM